MVMARTMQMLEIFLTVGIIFALLGFGWLLFSLAAGIVVYHSTMSTAHADIEPKSVLEAEKKTVAYSHTKDPVLMDPINEARDRWIKNQSEDLFDELSVFSRDGLRLFGYYWPRERELGKSTKIYSSKSEKGPERTVVLVHGLMDSASGMGYLAEEYHKLQWNVFVFDQRAHGKSEGNHRTMGVRESEDLALWVDLLVERNGFHNIYIHGISMGGASALLYAASKKRLSSFVRGLISDSSYSDYRGSLFRILESMVKNRFVARSITFGTNCMSILHTGVGFGKMNPEKKIHTIPVPLLLFHGQKDVLIPIVDARNLFSRSVKPADEMVVVPEAPHIGPYFYASDLYMQKIIDFARRNDLRAVSSEKLL